MSAGGARGTTPEGTRDEREASAWVRGMFGRIAGRYDLLNHLLSANIDRTWRRETVRLVRPYLRPGAIAVDLCCGTGDLAIALAEAAGEARVFGSDFCHPMLVAAQDKVARRPRALPLFEADALRLPLADGSIDLATMAFGFRNLANYDSGLSELRRVLRPGGAAAILEFSTPPNAAFAKAYEAYSRHVLPRLGALISGDGDAYRYLPESVKKFPGAEQLAAKMRAAGFSDIRFRRMTGGIVALHVGRA